MYDFLLLLDLGLDFDYDAMLMLILMLMLMLMLMKDNNIDNNNHNMYNDIDQLHYCIKIIIQSNITVLISILIIIVMNKYRKNKYKEEQIL